ncbi:hypothetical protein BKA81DRAFT_376486 [Phyllosticta paracitricarpa]|uniref:Uncharacterized protein n=1 Tax=Phyllosticta citricarpa TaxID=55181 RepID=A0ABR1MB43_9PEZI
MYMYVCAVRATGSTTTTTTLYQIAGRGTYPEASPPFFPSPVSTRCDVSTPHTADFAIGHHSCFLACHDVLVVQDDKESSENRQTGRDGPLRRWKKRRSRAAAVWPCELADRLVRLDAASSWCALRVFAEVMRRRLVLSRRARLNIYTLQSSAKQDACLQTIEPALCFWIQGECVVGMLSYLRSLATNDMTGFLTELCQVVTSQSRLSEKSFLGTTSYTPPFQVFGRGCGASWSFAICS